MAHLVFRSFPSSDQMADRIDEFLARLSRGELSRALNLCPIEDLNHALSTDAELAEAVRGRYAPRPEGDGDVARWTAGLGTVARGSGLTMVPGNDEVVVRATLHGPLPDVVAYFVLTESADDRWTLWFDRFERRT